MNQDNNQSVDQMASQIADSGTTTAPAFGLGGGPSSNNDANSTAGNQPDPTFTPVDDNSKTDNSLADDSSSQSNVIEPSKPEQSLGELGDIKKEALQKLAPIVDKLEQTPEEKYRTLMMLIQSSDDKSLIKSAYAAANQIEDESKKAEALLGVVNEIEYFSQNDQKN